MRKINFATLLVALITFLFISCSKDPENPSCITSSSSIAGTYKITAATYKAGPTAAEVDYMNYYYNEPCEKDNVFTFNSNGTYQHTDVGIVCSPSGTNGGTWALTGTTSMTIDGDDVIIESFDCKTLIIVDTETAAQVPGERLKYTFTKQ